MTNNSAPYTLKLRPIEATLTAFREHAFFFDGVSQRVQNNTNASVEIELSFAGETPALNSGEIAKDEYWDFIVPYGEVVRTVTFPLEDSGPIAIKVTHASGVGELTSGPDKGKMLYFDHKIGNTNYRAETNGGTGFILNAPVFSAKGARQNVAFDMMVHPRFREGEPDGFYISSNTDAPKTRNFWKVGGRVHDPRDAATFHYDDYYIYDKASDNYLGLAPFSETEPLLRKIVWGPKGKAIAIQRNPIR